MLKERVSDAIKISGVISIFLVVCIHYNTQGIATNSIDNFLQKVLQDGVGRAAVPLFAFFFGFFYFKNDNIIESFYLHSIRKRFHSIFIPYVIASFLFYILYETKGVYDGSYKTPHIKTILYDIFIYPKSSQLWFVRDLLVLSLLSPLFNCGNNKINYTIGFALLVMWFFQFQFSPVVGWYMLSIEMAFFYWLGVLVFKSDIIERLFFNKNHLFLIALGWFFYVA